MKLSLAVRSPVVVRGSLPLRHQPWRVALVPALVAAVLMLLSVNSAMANRGPVFAGKTVGNWGLAWWQWAANFSSADNPIAQPSGPVDCSTGQPRQVLFLAGTFGGEADRSCTVRPGRRCSSRSPISFLGTRGLPGACRGSLHKSLRQQASAAIDGFTITAQNCTVDGKPCIFFGQVTRAQSDPLPFDILAQSWVVDDLGYAPGTREFAISDGYWAMLHPLPVGEHTIRFTARNQSTGFDLDVTYHLTVAP